MKSLTLLRHAKSTWDDPVARDFDRPLNSRGRKAARIVGQAMRAQGLAFEAVIASPALRVVETLAEVEAGYGQLLGAEYDRRLYLAPAALLLDIARRVPESSDRLLLVGHNPGLEELAMMLAGEGEAALRDALAEKYPTATLAEISLPASRWLDVYPGSGTLTRFVRPRDLDPELGPDEDS